MSSSSMSIPSSSIRSISLKLPQFNLFPFSTSKPLFSFLRHHHPFSSSFKSISFQPLPTTKPPQSSSSSSSSSSVQQPIEELPPKLQEIIKLFQAAHDPRAKYQQLMFYANNLSPLSPHFKTNDNKVHGCVSQVWVRAFLAPPTTNNDDDKVVVYFEADSDSVMTKGLAALLVLGLSGQSIPDILRVSPDFVTLLGLHHSLTPSRNNGFLNMLKLMQRKALLLGLESEKNNNPGIEGDSAPGLTSQLAGIDQKLDNGSSGVESSHLDVGSGSSLSPSSSSDGLGRRGERIREILERELKPVELELEDVSYQHAGHVGVKGSSSSSSSSSSDGETHFNLKIVSNEFEGKSLVKRHRMIYGLLQDELEGGLHALSINAKTPLEVQQGK